MDKPTYYEDQGEMSDALLRCNDCRHLVTAAEWTKHGTCSCGCRRLLEVRSLSFLEWFMIRFGLLRFPNRRKFLREFRR